MMKLYFITLSVFILPIFTYSQIGVNTDNPSSTLDVSAAKNEDGTIDNTQIHGIQPPRLTREQLTSNVPYGPDQTGAIIYITDVSGGDTGESRINIDSEGYYYYDGNEGIWKKLIGAASTSETVTASNGLTKTGTDIALGGSLSKPTTIDSSSNPLIIEGGNLEIKDGKQGVGSILTSIDANGTARWTTPEYAKPTTLGKFDVSSDRYVATNTFAGGIITLTKGYWLVYVGALVNANFLSDATTTNAWIRLTLGTNSGDGAAVTTDFKFLSSSLISGFSPMAKAGSIPNGYFSFLTGTLPINVTADTLTLYLRYATIEKNGNPAANSMWIGNNSENYIFAVPISSLSL